MTDRPSWDPFTPRGTREATARILTDGNYRLFYEGATRRTLIETYGNLAKLARKLLQFAQRKQHAHYTAQWRSLKPAPCVRRGMRPARRLPTAKLANRRNSLSQPRNVDITIVLFTVAFDNTNLQPVMF